MKNLCFILVIGLLVVACKRDKKSPTANAKAYPEIEQLNWLVGNWENTTELEQSYENWTQKNDSTLLGHSFTLIGTDTVFAEKVTLKQVDDEVFFTVIAYQQNDDKPVTFKLSSTEAGIFTFDNPEHDFPTRISYSNPSKDSIHAWIEGQVDGEFQKIDFKFQRSN